MRVVLVHGSVGNGPATWAALQPLAERYELVVPNRGGYPPNPPLERIDFEQQAEELAPLLADGAHLVGHSYGGVISLLIAARHPGSVRSLTVSEPPAFRVARGRKGRKEGPVDKNPFETAADEGRTSTAGEFFYFLKQSKKAEAACSSRNAISKRSRRR